MNLKSILAAVAVSSLLPLTAACGGADKTEICTEASKIITDYGSQVGAAAGNADGINKANADVAAKLKELADKADGDLKTALTGIADTWANLKIDVSDPTKTAELATQATQAAQDLARACGS